MYTFTCKSDKIKFNALTALMKERASLKLRINTTGKNNFLQFIHQLHEALNFKQNTKAWPTAAQIKCKG